MLSDSDSLIREALTALLSGSVGFAAALATFSAKFSLLAQERQTLADKVESDRQHDKELLATELEAIRSSVRRHNRTTRRAFQEVSKVQHVTLELVAGIANKANVVHRALGADALATLLNAENSNGK